MNLPRFAVHRPVLTVMLALIVIILGGISLARLAIDLMPDITYPTVTVSTTYENANPQEIEELITRPIEEAMSAIPGVEEVTSTSFEGVSNVRLTFTWGVNLDTAMNDVRDRLDRVIARLPDDADRPILRKFDVASFPILILGVAGNFDPIQLAKIVDSQVKNRLERLPGVAAVDVQGALQREIHVNLNPEKLKALGLAVESILVRLKEENIVLPAGSLEKGLLNINIRTPGGYAGMEEIQNTVIALRQGAPIQLKEIAVVEDSSAKVTRIVRVNGQPGVRLSINKQAGWNTVEVASGVLKEIEQINEDLPQIQITSIIDSSAYIKRSIQNVSDSLWYGGILAIIVIFLFLGSMGSTAVIATSIPISVIATFGLMYFGGFTLNLMTLGGLALGIGMLVDNAIVVLENIHRLRETGRPPEQSAVEGAQEVVAAIVASTLTILVVFLPLIFIRGISGEMFRQLAYIVSFSLACSLITALTLVPMLASKMHVFRKNNGNVKQKHKVLTYISQRLFKQIIEQGYGRLLGWALRHQKSVIAGTVAVLSASLALVPLIGVEFMPNTDEGEVRIRAEMAEGTRLEVLDERIKTIEDLIQGGVPEIQNMVSFVGGTGYSSGGSHIGNIRIALLPAKERKRSSDEIAADLRRQLTNIPGTKVRVTAGQGLFFLRMGSSDGNKIQLDIYGNDLDLSQKLAEYLRALVETVPGATDVRLSRGSAAPEELIIVDRQKAASLKVPLAKVANMLQTLLAGSTAGYFRESGDEYRILVKLQDAEQMNLQDILTLPVLNADGQAIILKNMVTVRPQYGPILIERKNRERIITLSANAYGRDMGSILKDIREKLRNVPLPRDFSVHFSGDYQEQQKSFRELLLGFMLSLVLIYMVMASLYESLWDPLIVMFSVPMAVIGVILMLFLTNTTFNVQSYIGCIMLGGIVVNNAILLVDHTKLLRTRDQMPLVDAVIEAGRRRLRPILMTSLTTILGLLPLALGIGEGAEAQAPLARAIMGGLLSGKFITLIFVPVIYVLFHRWLEKRKNRGTG